MSHPWVGRAFLGFENAFDASESVFSCSGSNIHLPRIDPKLFEYLVLLVLRL
jgi:hypothetical protein